MWTNTFNLNIIFQFVFGFCNAVWFKKIGNISNYFVKKNINKKNIS